jgi:hypothetical protein
LDLYIYSQIFGAAAFVLIVGSYQILSQKGMFAVRSLGDVMYAFHYFLLGGFSAVITLIVGITRTSVIVFWKPDLKYIAIPVTILVVFAVCFFSPEVGWPKYLPLIVSAANSIAQYYHDNFIKCRSIMLASPIAWLAYGWILNSYTAIALSIFLLTSHAIAIIRYILKNKEK